MKLQKTAETGGRKEPAGNPTIDRVGVAGEKWRQSHQQFQIKKIVVPVDFSEPSKNALQYAMCMAKEFEAELILIHVVQPYPLIPDLPAATAELNVLLGKDATSNLQKVADTVKGVPVTQVVRVGNPPREIAEEADKQNADLIIISTHGRTGLAHVFIGSVAERVVRYAKCPVLTLRESEREFVQVPVDDAELNRVGTTSISS